jgi:hypothetical protein
MAAVGFSTDDRGYLDGLYLAHAEKGRLTSAIKIDNGMTDKERQQLKATPRPW